MSYRWSNKKRLSTLDAEGADGVLAVSTPSELAEVHIRDGDIARVVCRVGAATTELGSDDAHHLVVGEGNTQRDVYHYLRPGGPTRVLRLGITKHRGFGTWSSLPHPFELRAQPGFEEVFFYLLRHESKTAIQVGRGVWYDGTPVNTVWKVRDHTWCTIPMGYHPVVGEPGVHVSYLWTYLAKRREWEKI